MNQTCIIVPVYNHPSRLEWLVGRLEKTGLPILLVNDGSDADCSRLMLDLAKGQENITLIERDYNGGKGAAVKSGLLVAQAQGYSHALQIDADGQHEIGDIPNMLELSETNPYALVSGEPHFKDIPRIRYYGRYLTHIWVWINTWSLEIRDSMCGFRVYPVDICCRVIRKSRIGDRMDFDTEIMVRLHWEGVQVVHLPTSVLYPPDNLSHFRGLQDNFLISLAHARLFFGMIWRIPRLLSRKLGSHG